MSPANVFRAILSIGILGIVASGTIVSFAFKWFLMYISFCIWAKATNLKESLDEDFPDWRKK